MLPADHWWIFWLLVEPTSLSCLISRTSPITTVCTPFACKVEINRVVCLCSISLICCLSFLNCFCLERMSFLRRLEPFFLRSIFLERCSISLFWYWRLERR